MRLQEIAYRLAYYGDHPDLERVIVETVARLPEDVAEFVLEKCRLCL